MSSQTEARITELIALNSRIAHLRFSIFELMNTAKSEVIFLAGLAAQAKMLGLPLGDVYVEVDALIDKYLLGRRKVTA